MHFYVFIQFLSSVMTCLCCTSQDVARCMELMADLERLPLNAFLLRKNPHIILTLRKVPCTSIITRDCVYGTMKTEI